jgi:hypothetical protein
MFRFIGATGLSLPQLPQMFGLIPKNESTNGSNAGSPIVSNAQNGFEFARLFASNFLNNTSTKNDVASGSKRLAVKPESSSSGTPNRLQNKAE